ncbi:hypothetical protein SPACI_025910 [Sporomusa acidovorans DSM 3132]|uniref:Uncharacterized protein n=1 Tax=Sporomusa acidovorans (strain ATCC 49682 / DSM 3132 / Mol) TaxID=1123286 RepID=A0ABZ3J389_SPOA4|nr:hypothetical protein SPACI_24330 [Sporomusa acidovorans DSM 3132]SDD46951.1 hypothetical protein SAMN04488499_1001356 [Sporomusa acidovorans]
MGLKIFFYDCQVADIWTKKPGNLPGFFVIKISGLNYLNSYHCSLDKIKVVRC